MRGGGSFEAMSNGKPLHAGGVTRGSTTTTAPEASTSHSIPSAAADAATTVTRLCGAQSGGPRLSKCPVAGSKRSISDFRSEEHTSELQSLFPTRRASDLRGNFEREAAARGGRHARIDDDDRARGVHEPQHSVGGR